jgi:hypothetical protein
VLSASRLPTRLACSSANLSCALASTSQVSEPSCQASIVLESRNARDITQAELDDLAREIDSELVACGRRDVSAAAVAHDATGGGHSWTDVLYVFLPSADFLKDAVWTTVLERVERFLRRRFDRPHEASRPRVLVVRESEGGEVLEVRELKAEDAELVKAAYDAEPRMPPKV